jgi:hypothetical protein
MAEIGAQPGNQNARKAKIWEQALKRALARASNATVDAGLDKIADTVVAQAMEGNKDAWQEIGQRLDGKVPQALIGGDEEDAAIKVAVSRIELVDLK